MKGPVSATVLSAPVVVLGIAVAFVGLGGPVMVGLKWWASLVTTKAPPARISNAPAARVGLRTAGLVRRAATAAGGAGGGGGAVTPSAGWVSWACAAIRVFWVWGAGALRCWASWWANSWQLRYRSGALLAIATANTASSPASSGRHTPIRGGAALSCRAITTTELDES